MKELIEKWKEFQQTSEFTQQELRSQENDNPQFFLAFMDWLERNTNE